MPGVAASASSASASTGSDDDDLETGSNYSKASSEVRRQRESGEKQNVGKVLNAFQADKIWDKRKLKNNIAREWEDIIWFWRYPIVLVLIGIHLMPLLHMLVLEKKKVGQLELILNGLFPLFVPVAFAMGYKAPILLSICENNYLYASQEYKVACSWCNGCVVIFLMFLLAIVAVHRYPWFFACAAFDMFWLWVVTWRICKDAGKSNDRFAANAQRADSRRELEEAGVISPRAPQTPRLGPGNGKVIPRSQTVVQEEIPRSQTIML